MMKILIAVAMTIALPVAAFAQATAAQSAAAPAAHAGPDMKAMNCKDMHAMMVGSHSGHHMSGASGQSDRSKMDHSKMDHSKMAGCGDMPTPVAQQAPANPHASHQQ